MEVLQKEQLFSNLHFIWSSSICSLLCKAIRPKLPFFLVVIPSISPGSIAHSGPIIHDRESLDLPFCVFPPPPTLFFFFPRVFMADIQRRTVAIKPGLVREWSRSASNLFYVFSFHLVKLPNCTLVFFEPSVISSLSLSLIL